MDDSLDREHVVSSGEPSETPCADEASPAASSEGEEAARLAALRRYHIIEAPPLEHFDRLTRLAARHFGAAATAVNFVEAERQWTKSCYGFDGSEPFSREAVFCQYTIQEKEPLVVEDARQDARFSELPIVKEAPYYRFYAGAPLCTPDGYAIGSFCVLDPEPRSFSSEEQADLQDFAATVMDALEQKRLRYERAEAERVRRREEERHRRLVERSSDIVSVLNPDGMTQYENGAVEQILGRPSVVGIDAALEKVHPDDRQGVRDALREVSERPGRVRSVEHRDRHADGHWVPLESMMRNLMDDPAIEGIVVNTRDMTERKEKEKHLRLMNAVIENAEDGVATVQVSASDASDAEITYVNDTFCRNTGYAREDVLGLHPRFLVGPGTNADELARVCEAIAKRQPVRTELINYRQDGTSFWANMSIIPIRDETGCCTHFTAIQRDVTGRREREEALRKSETRFRTVFENVRDIIFQTDADGRFTLLSPSWESITGYTVEESIGEQYTEYIETEEENLTVARYRERVSEDDTVADRVRVRTKSGTLRWLRVQSRVYRNDEGEIVGGAGTLSDVTDSLQMEAEREARERAEELLEAKSAFLNNMSHELRTPLASILGFAEVLADEAEGAHREFARRIGQSGKRLRNTLESILRLAQLEAQGEADFDYAALDVSTAARRAAAAHRPSAQEKGLALRVEAPEPGAVYARLDEGALGRVLDNLLSNAIKFTETGHVALVVEREGEEVHLSVTDTGIGIGEDFQNEIFSDFTQESRGLSRTHEGSGLGLSIAWRLVEGMGGTLNVSSALEEGATFTAVFRCLSDTEGGIEVSGTPEEEAKQEVAETATLLLVEDNPNTRALAERLLRQRYRVESIVNGQELDDLPTARFDAFLIDINLGDGEESGIDLLARLRAEPGGAGVPAIAFTAHAMPGDEKRYREAGFDGYVAKPFSKTELQEAVEEALTTVIS